MLGQWLMSDPLLVFQHLLQQFILGQSGKLVEIHIVDSFQFVLGEIHELHPLLVVGQQLAASLLLVEQHIFVDYFWEEIEQEIKVALLGLEVLPLEAEFFVGVVFVIS
jgi:hypothetical protein